MLTLPPVMFAAKKPAQPDRTQQMDWRQNEFYKQKNLAPGQVMAQVATQLIDQLKRQFKLEVLSYLVQTNNEIIFLVLENPKKRPVHSASNVEKKLKDLGVKKTGDQLTYTPPGSEFTFKIQVLPMNTLQTLKDGLKA